MDDFARIIELRQASVDRLMCAEVFEKRAFEDLADLLAKNAHICRIESAVPRVLLATTMSAISAIASRRDCVPELQQEDRLIEKLEAVLHALCYGQDPGERQPGVPRVI